MRRFGSSLNEWAIPSPKLSDHLDATRDIRIQAREFVRRDPVFTMSGVPDHVDLVSAKKLVLHVEPQHVSRET